MKIFPISGFKYGVDEKVGMGLKARIQRFKVDIYEANSGHAYDPKPTDTYDNEGEEIWRDLEYEKWFHIHAQDYEVQLGMAEVALVPLKGSPPIREIFGEADEEEVWAALSFFGDVVTGIAKEQGILPETSIPKTPALKKSTRKGKAVS
jgi:hypothetical protein